MLDSPFIQIAGIKDLAEAQMVLKAGATHLGFPFRLNYHQPDLTEEQAREIISRLNISGRSVLITYLTSASEILALVSYLGVSTVQLHADLPLRAVAELRSLNEKLIIIKSLVVRQSNQQALKDLVAEFSPHVDGFITDTFDPCTGASGATGKTHDWAISRELIRLSPRPVILAGGLHPGNVAQAIRTVQPYGVDAHTGVEGVDGRKNAGLAAAFIKEALAAFKTSSHGTGSGFKNVWTGS